MTRIGIAPEVFEMFPGYVRHVLIAGNADNFGEPDELKDMLNLAQEALRSDESFADLKLHPRIASWRDAFGKFGINPNQCPPSTANLIKRVRSGKNLPYINKLVCIFNIISMKYVLPAGGDDLDKVAGDVLLGPATGDEAYVPLGSSGPVERPKPGEIILFDTGNLDVFCRAWCWKNGDRSRIEASTRSVAINIDALPPVTADDGARASEETATLVSRFCGADVAIHRLSAENTGVNL
jgi:lysyl-tRNA synthetase class 2